MKALLETGVHFGHRTRKWNPKMATYIFTERNGIHILDLHQTLKAIREGYDLVRDSVANGGKLLFVGTKRQAQETIAREAERANMPHINERWLGGTLTNWRTIRQRIDHLKNLEARRDRGEFELITKKEALDLTREIERLNERLGGIRNMTSLPELIFVVDVQREATAIHEANILNIPVIAMVDTNGDPDMVDYVIPSNDDAIRAIKLVASVMADAVLEGVMMRKDSADEIDEGMAAAYDYPVVEVDDEVDDEEFLGEATLAKLRSGSLSFEAEEPVAAEAEPETEVSDEAVAAEAETVVNVEEVEAPKAKKATKRSKEQLPEQEA
jgi:small subunit ribosomal protein S2